MHTLSFDQMTYIEGGGLFGCAIAMGVASGFGSLFRRILAKYFTGLPLGCVDGAMA